MKGAHRIRLSTLTHSVNTPTAEYFVTLSAHTQVEVAFSSAQTYLQIRSWKSSSQIRPVRQSTHPHTTVCVCVCVGARG